jgi:hypothetical protein
MFFRSSKVSEVGSSVGLYTFIGVRGLAREGPCEVGDAIHGSRGEAEGARTNVGAPGRRFLLLPFLRLPGIL